MPRITPRYFHGDLPLHKHVAFIESYYGTRPPGPFVPSTRKGLQRGEVFRLRGTMRMAFPGWRTTVMSQVCEAIASKPEWREWYKEVFEERKGKLEKRRKKKGKDPKTGRKLKGSDASQ